MARNADARLSIGGEIVAKGGNYCFNQHKMMLSIGDLDYEFAYTDYASTFDYVAERLEFMFNSLQCSEPPSPLTLTPTQQRMRIGDYTLSKPLGWGASGTVWSATNSRNGIFAIKLMSFSTRRATNIEHEVEILQALTELAESKGDEGHLLRLKEVIHQDSPAAAFGSIALAFTPAAEMDFTQLIRQRGWYVHLREDGKSR